LHNDKTGLNSMTLVINIFYRKKNIGWFT